MRVIKVRTQVELDAALAKASPCDDATGAEDDCRDMHPEKAVRS